MAYRITLDKGIPLPPGRTGTMYSLPYPHLLPGDSFLVPATSAKISSIQKYASARGKQLGCRFTTRRVEGGIRVWRVA